MNENLSLGRIAGIHVGLNWSLPVTAFLIASPLATNFLPSAAPGQTSSAYWTAGVTSAFVYLVCLLAHELAHSIVAMRRGVKVDGITLWLFGGVSRFSRETSSPAATGGGADNPGLLSATLFWLGFINLLLGAFNLLPAFPLDGGRILQSLIWARAGVRLRAPRSAARLGMGFAFLFIAYGLITFFASGNFLNAVWSV